MNKRWRLAMAVALFGCGDATQPELLSAQREADNGNEAVSEAMQESELVFALTAADSSQAADDDELAANARDEAANQWTGSCLTADIDRNVVTYTLDNCTGRFRLVTVTGVITATYTRRDDGLHAAIVGQGLEVNNGVANLDAKTVTRWEGLTRTMEIDTNWTGETARGEPTSRVGDYTTTVDLATLCLTVDGDWATSVGAVAWDTTVDGFKVCAGECPADGGSIEWVGPRRTTTLTYDGTDYASWQNDQGASGSVRLYCGR